MHVVGDLPITRLNVFSIDKVQSVEPYIAGTRPGKALELSLHPYGAKAVIGQPLSCLPLATRLAIKDIIAALLETQRAFGAKRRPRPTQTGHIIERRQPSAQLLHNGYRRSSLPQAAARGADILPSASRAAFLSCAWQA